MTARAWDFKDILEISKIEEECFSSPWSFKMIADTFLTGHFHGVLIEEEKTIIGYGGFLSVSVEANITNIAVKKEFRNRKIGNLIVDKMIEKCINIGVKELFLEVRESNIIAKTLYEKKGFIAFNKRKNYYADGETCIEMKKII